MGADFHSDLQADFLPPSLIQTEAGEARSISLKKTWVSATNDVGQRWRRLMWLRGDTLFHRGETEAVVPPSLGITECHREPRGRDF